jgi:hypothetical protein
MKKRSRAGSIFGQSAPKNPHDSSLRSSSNQHKCTMSKAAREAAPSLGPYLIRACHSALEGGAVQSVVGSDDYDAAQKCDRYTPLTDVPH